jgi:hypothetical protein
MLVPLYGKMDARERFVLHWPLTSEADDLQSFISQFPSLFFFFFHSASGFARCGN